MTDPVYVRLGAQVRARRLELGMTQAQLGARVGMSRTSVTNIECGRQPMLVHQLQLMAASLGLDAAAMLGAASVAGAQGRRPEVAADMQALLARLDGTVEA